MFPKRTFSMLSLGLALGLFTAGSAEGAPMTPREIYKEKGPAVVLVFATDGSAQGSAGTGSIISKDGQVITNAHVVSKNGRPYRRLFVYMKPAKLRGSMKYDLKRRYKATLVDVNEKLDLALLRMVDPPSGLETIDFVDPDAVEVGEPVVAIGHPETGGLWTLTTGSISSVVADFGGVTGKDVFQTEASVNRGNSGGPLLNAYGQMVGINTSISRKANDGLAITDINFSLKSSVAVEWLRRRKLMNLAYAKPGLPSTIPPGTALASNSKPSKPAKPRMVIREGDVKLAVVEPEKGSEVADDPEFAQSAQASTVVSRGASVPEGGKTAQTAKPLSKKPKTQVKPKILTVHRPYELDDFVEDRIQEIKKMENLMDEMRGKIDSRRNRKQRSSQFDRMGI